MNKHIFCELHTGMFEIEIPTNHWYAWVDQLLPVVISTGALKISGSRRSPKWKINDPHYNALTFNGSCLIMDNLVPYTELMQVIDPNNVDVANITNNIISIKHNILLELINDSVFRKMVKDYSKSYMEAVYESNHTLATTIINSITTQMDIDVGIEPQFWCDLDTITPSMIYSTGANLYKVDDINTYLSTGKVTRIGTSMSAVTLK